MHTRVVASGFESDVVVGTALVNMYAKCGSLEDASKSFDKIPQRNAVSWNTMLSAFAHHGKPKEALQLFQQMQVEGVVPDRVTLVGILSACASEAALAE
eukprot:c15908_g1_i1 orf=138-434(+)